MYDERTVALALEAAELACCSRGAVYSWCASCV